MKMKQTCSLAATLTLALLPYTFAGCSDAGDGIEDDTDGSINGDGGKDGARNDSGDEQDATTDARDSGGDARDSGDANDGGGEDDAGDAGDAGDGGDSQVCVPGTTASCYTGPNGTEGVGACAAGTKTCNQDGTGYEDCHGDVIPRDEICDGIDNDCDGDTDANDADLAVHDSPLCETQTGACNGTKKPPNLCVNGAWAQCDETTYESQVPPQCDDGDNCTEDHTISVCAATCSHVRTCAGTTTVLPTEDATIDSARAATNYGAEPTLVLESNTRRALLRFDLSAHHYGQLNRAFLKVHIGPKDFREFRVFPVSTAWSETTVTWDTKPTIAGQNIVAPALPSVDPTLITFDITELVQGWLNNPATNFGFALGTTVGQLSATIVSREGAAADAPKLELIFNAASATLACEADTYGLANSPADTHGIEERLTFASSADGVADYSRVLMKFDATPIPVGSTVLYAEARLVQDGLGSWVGPFNAHTLNASFDEAAAAWSTFPATGPALGRFFSPSNADNSVKTAVITTAVQDWLGGTNHGLMIRNDVEGGSTQSRRVSLGSRESPIATKRPQVQVLYRAP